MIPLWVLSQFLDAAFRPKFIWWVCSKLILEGTILALIEVITRRVLSLIPGVNTRQVVSSTVRCQHMMEHYLFSPKSFIRRDFIRKDDSCSQLPLLMSLKLLSGSGTFIFLLSTHYLTWYPHQAYNFIAVHVAATQCLPSDTFSLLCVIHLVRQRPLFTLC